jgi:hypothetical protein
MLGIWKPFRPVVLRTRFLHAEVVKRLRAGIDQPWTLFGSKPIHGEVTDTKFVGWPRRWTNRGFQLRLVARIAPEATGTRLDCAARVHSFHIFFLGFWMIGVVSISSVFWWQLALAIMDGSVSWAKLSQPDLNWKPFFGSLFGLFAVFWGFMIAAAGLNNSQDDPGKVLAFLKTTLDAEEVRG